MIIRYYFLFGDGSIRFLPFPLRYMKFEKHKMGIICIGIK